MRLVRRALGLAMLAGVLGVIAALVWCDVRVRAYLAGPPLGGTRIYAAPTVLRVGDPVETHGCAARAHHADDDPADLGPGERMIAPCQQRARERERQCKH